MPAPTTILITTFEPFGGASVNGSLEAGRLLAERDERIRLVTLPVVSGKAEQAALAALEDGPLPLLMLSLGEKRIEPFAIHLEKVAINYDDFRIPDNAGQQPRDTPIRSGESSPAAYFSTLPVAALQNQLAEQTPLPLAVSLSAGAFLCNHVAYCILDAFHQSAALAPPYAFIHVPAWRPEQGSETLENVVATLSAIVEAALANS